MTNKRVNYRKTELSEEHVATGCTGQSTPNEIHPICSEFFQFTLAKQMGENRLLENAYAIEDEVGNVVRYVKY